MRSLGRALIQSDGCPRKTRVFRPKRDTGGIRAQGKTGRTQREGSHVRPRREDCGEATAADSLISDSSPRDCKKVNCCCLSHQSVLFYYSGLSNRVQTLYEIDWIYQIRDEDRFNFLKSLSCIQKCSSTLAAVAQWAECRPEIQRVADWVPTQGSCLGCRPAKSPVGGVRGLGEPRTDVSLPLFLPPFPSL